MPILPSQSLMFRRSTAQILEWKSNLQREENWNTRRKTLRIRLRWINLSPRAEPRARTQVVEMGGATDDHYANLTPLAPRMWIHSFFLPFSLTINVKTVNSSINSNHRIYESKWFFELLLQQKLLFIHSSALARFLTRVPKFSRLSNKFTVWISYVQCSTWFFKNGIQPFPRFTKYRIFNHWNLFVLWWQTLKWKYADSWLYWQDGDVYLIEEPVVLPTCKNYFKYYCVFLILH